MANAIEIRGLTKEFKHFKLNAGDIDIPKGYVTGIVGSNGAGKSTLMNCITGTYIPTSGKITWEKEPEQGSIGLIYGECPFLGLGNANNISKTFGRCFPDWDEKEFFRLCSEYKLDRKKKIIKYSDGMKKLIQAAVAFSHPTDILILDEPTLGLDPINREDLLDKVMDYMMNEEHTVIITSNITSDLEKIADYIIFLKEGEIVINGRTDDILNEYGILRSFDESIRDHFVAVRKGEFSWTALVKDKNGLRATHPELTVDDATIEDIAVYLIRGD